ncbi:MAG: MMPL family transporter [Deltaproteobacteria bacterium]|jgi:uncharacterized protein|nr:MMPL family transporter [Deltaproteobacteria bacterium]
MREQKGQESIFTRLALLIGGFAGEHCRSSLGIILGLTVILLPSLGQVEYDDDILKFLPEDSPQVSQFQEIGERFQGLNIAMLGVQAPANEDLFTPRRLRELRELTETLTTVEGVSFSSSFMALQDIEVQKSDDGLDDVSVVNDLIPEIPPVDSPEVKVFVEDARKRVLSREHVVGAMISEDGKAALVLGYLKPGTIGKDVADAIRKHADGLLAKNQSDLEIHYGGAPFVGSYIVHTTRDDILRLSLISGCAIIFILILTARSLTGALIALSSVGIGILWVVGLMGLVGEPLTLVSSSLPMLLLALGSAYSIHILVRVFAHLDSGSVDRLTAVREAVREVGPPIFIAGLTSALAFLSFVAMDIAPMRSFGVWMFVGTLVIVFLALVVVPAACVLFPLPVREGGRTPAWALKGMIDGANFVIRKPWLTAVVIGILVGGSWVYMGEGKTHMTMRDFFLEGSEPVLAEDFLEDHLGGSVYMQIQVTGDIKDPLVLMEIDRIATYAAAQPGVTNTQSIMDAMLLAGEALFGERRVPANPDTVRAIAALAEGDPNLRLIVDPKWEHALIHVKVRNENIADALAFAKRLEAVEGASWQVDRVRVTRSTMTDAEAEVERREMISHLVSVLEKDGIQGVSNAALSAALQKEVKAPGADVLLAPVLEQLGKDIINDEMIYLREGATLQAVAPEVAGILTAGMDIEALYQVLWAIADDEDREDPEAFRESVLYIAGNLSALVQGGAVSGRVKDIVAIAGGKVTPSARSALKRVLGVLGDDTASLPKYAVTADRILATVPLKLDVTGTPLVYEGMNVSVQKNQEQSLAISSVLVFLALAVFFRRLSVAFVASVPAGFTLMITFGIMGLSGIPMDVGTSMMTSIAIGIGIDYAVHFIWHYGTPAANETNAALEDSMKATGWGIVVNALEVAIGFALLALGNIVPMRNVGLLTAAAMLVSAFATLILVPALLRWLGPIHSTGSTTS